MTEDRGQGLTLAAIGAFTVGGVALLVGAVVLFGRFNLFSTTLRAAIVFQDTISGLSIGAPVTFRGVRVGAVEGITVQFDSQTRMAVIPVTIVLDPAHVVLTGGGGKTAADLSQLIASGLRAELDTQSFVTGSSAIGLDFDPAYPAVLHPGITTLPEIPARPSVIQLVTNQLTQLPLRELAENGNATLKSLRALSDKLDQSLPPLIDRLTAISGGLAGVVAAAGHTLTELQARIDATLGDIDRVARTGDAQLAQRGAELHAVLTSSDRTIAAAREVLANLKSLTSDRGAERVNIDAALQDLATTAASLRGLANDVEHNPQLLLTGRRP